MAKKTYSINWEDDEPVSFEVDGVQYESLEDVPEETDRLKLEAMMNAAEDAEFDAEIEKIDRRYSKIRGWRSKRSSFRSSPALRSLCC